MSPEQEVSLQFSVTAKEIAEMAGFDPKNPNDFEVFRQRLATLKRKDPTIVPYKIVGIRHFYLGNVAEQIVREISRPIRRTTGRLADYTEDIPPQEGHFTNLSQAELLERSNKERENNRLKRQAQEQRKKEAERIKKRMPLHFTNEVLRYMVENKLNDLNRNLNILLDHALKKVNSGNGKITLAFVLDGQPKEDTQRYFIQQFNFLLERGFNNTNTQNHKPLSEEEKKLIEQCNCLKDQNQSQERVLKEVSIHFDIPLSYILFGA